MSVTTMPMFLTSASELFTSSWVEFLLARTCVFHIAILYCIIMGLRERQWKPWTSFRWCLFCGFRTNFVPSTLIWYQLCTMYTDFVPTSYQFRTTSYQLRTNFVPNTSPFRTNAINISLVLLRLRLPRLPVRADRCVSSS